MTTLKSGRAIINEAFDELWHLRDLLSSAADTLDRAMDAIEPGQDRDEILKRAGVVQQAHTAIDELVAYLE